MVLFFSATGNCKYVATRLIQSTKQQMFSIADCIRNGQYDFSDGAIGIVSPTYDWGLPSIVKEFLEKASFKTDYLYFVATYSDNSADRRDLISSTDRSSRSSSGKSM